MIKSVRFLSRYYLTIVGAIALFAVVVAVSVGLTKGLDGPLGSYYRIFPMLCALIVGITCSTQGNQFQIALGMNAGRRGLFWANQVMLVASTLCCMAITAVLWRFGGLLGVGGALGLLQFESLWVLAPMGAACLMAAEGGAVIGHTGMGKLRRVLMVIYIILMMVICFGLAAASAVITMEQVAFGDYTTLAVVTGVLLAVSVALAGVEYGQMRKAVVW